MCNKKSNISRRKFLKQSGTLALGASTVISSLAGMKVFGMLNQMENMSSGGAGDYRALVCFFFKGGNDSFNMLMPKGGSLYDQYQITRSNLAIPAEDILQIFPSNVAGSFGFHPSMPEVQTLFNEGKLATINNVGMMIQPTSKADYFDGTGDLPLGLYSHADQIQQWETSSPHVRSAIGWAGRMAELMQSENANSLIPMNISLNGNSILLGGNALSEFVIGPGGAVGIEGYGDTNWDYSISKTQAIDEMLNSSYDNIFMEEYKKVVKQSNNANLQFQNAIDNVPDFGTEFSGNGISGRFRMIAKAIAARESLGFNKQVFVVEYGGWDHHDELLNNQAGKLAIVSKAMSEFNSAMEELGISDCVTTFTMSEFARTLTSNGNGTDHAWGGNAMVMGGAVNGGQMYGQYPSNLIFSDDNPITLDGGSILPTTASDQYFAELAKWFGVSNNDLNSIFPNLNNFYDSNSNIPPLGFMNI